ncbi:MAG: lysylphosphatidylglycerol synthase transmembrane domain-containing protein [bacterium]
MWKSAPFITSVLLLFGVIFFVVGYGKEHEFIKLLRHSKPAWLLAAVALQGLTYVCAAGIWQRPLSRYGEHRSLNSLIPLGLAKLFTDQAVPSAGLSGTLLVARALKRRGISRDLTMTALLVGLVAYYLAYAMAVASALFVLWFYGDLNKMTIIMATVFSLLVAIVPLGVFWLHRHPDFKIPSWLKKAPGVKDIQDALAGASTNMFSSPGLIAQTVLLHFAVFVLDAATLSVMLRAVGSPAGFAPVFASFVIGSVVATIMVMPGGIGTFEGSAIAMLHMFGVPLEASLASVLLLRGFTFWLPMIPGLWLARREML